MEKKKDKPKYNLFQNTGYMIGKAWKHTPSILWLILAIIVVTVLQSLAGLYIAPSVLEKVETHAPLAVLLRTIGLFAGSLLILSALDGFFSEQTTLMRTHLRVLYLGTEIHTKFWQTSYPNTQDPAFLKKADTSMNAMGGNNSTLEAVWDTLTKLASDLIRFAIYLVLLTGLHPILVMVVLASSAASYLLTLRASNWAYQHREERAGYIQRLDYVSIRTRDRALAKDVRIFGFKAWFE
ncbi:MAG: ABC transporter ATP-binding protein, partial [Oscillospiraceae bacterium]|nr:ABC transporter ATP-binding protein [Oscillospiraceae bacterium]